MRDLTRDRVRDLTRDRVRDLMRGWVRALAREPVLEPVRKPVRDAMREPVREPARDPRIRSQNRLRATWIEMGISDRLLRKLGRLGIRSRDREGMVGIWHKTPVGEETREDRPQDLGAALDEILEREGSRWRGSIDADVGRAR